MNCLETYETAWWQFSFFGVKKGEKRHNNKVTVTCNEEDGR
ncbi:hypothetical protein KKC1_22820 [Calderihabitans maritimus]|uniref:Uncharacterized protein n=1 Tax=Calderihabitans maritimus TaxID=1246530 RepID=A0A1Z5HUY0_9FIRM|nr:hypothetical protein KKC1_22820 [Calderihabitans maritimus]